MNFPEYDCDNEEILEFLSYLPITTEEDYPWMNKFIVDLLLHYKKEEYELSILSAHLIYMYILYCFMLKKRNFNLNDIKNDFTGKKEKIPSNISPFIYSIKHEKAFFCTSLLNIPDCEQDHTDVVEIRNEVAHASGIYKSKEDFKKYISICNQNIAKTNEAVSSCFRSLSKFLDEIKDTSGYYNIIQDFLLSPFEWREIFEEFANERICDYLSNPNNWEDMLNNTTPANYGINDSEFYVEKLELNYDDINEELIQGIFTADVSCNIDFQMASSKPDDGYEEHYYETHNISGTFEYDLISNNFSVEMDNQPLIDFYAE